MRRLKQDVAAGFLHLGIDTLDDLWTLRNLIEPGDLITASTYRTAEGVDDKIRSEKAEKKRMTLGVRVTDVDWHDFDDHLRVHGVIETGPQDLGRHHTHVLRHGYGSDVKINKPKRLMTWHKDLISEAIEAGARPQILLLAIDDSEAQFAELVSYGLRMLGALPAGGQGKRFDEKGAAAAKARFYAETLKSLKTLRTEASIPLLVVGPGWWREEFLEYATAKDAQVVQGARTDGTSQGGTGGLHEALRRGMLESVARDHRTGVETGQVEEVFARIGKADGLVAYGPAEVELAVQAGAAEAVLVTDQAVRTKRHPGVLDAAEASKCHVHIVATGHDAGQRLESLGGVAALLRFSIT